MQQNKKLTTKDINQLINDGGKMFKQYAVYSYYYIVMPNGLTYYNFNKNALRNLGNKIKIEYIK